MAGAGTMAGMSTSADRDVVPAGTAIDGGPGGTGIDVVLGTYAQAQAAGLVELLQAEYVARYGGPDETPMDGAQFDPPAGRFVLGYLDGAIVACGGWRAHGPDQAEIKRMFVAEGARRRGLAARILAELERTATDAGMTTMVLETGDAQPEAIALYLAASYRPTEKFGHYRDSPQSVSLAKALAS
jgi:GNAT superfamily N-acetyltransferase